jgi:hypothetical protein
LKLDPAEKPGSQHVVVDMLLEIHELGQIHSVLRELRAAPNVTFADRQRPGGRLVGATKRTPRRPTAREK